MSLAISRWQRTLWLPLPLLVAGLAQAQDGRLPPAPATSNLSPREAQVGLDPDAINNSPILLGVEPQQRLRDVSWTYIDTLQPKRIRVHDIITIIVSENSEVTQNALYNRQRNGIFKTELKEFIRLGDTGNLRPAALDGPTIDMQLRSNLQALGNATSRDSIRYRIAATVVDVLPNGTLVLEARKSIRTNGDLWEYKLTGRISSDRILANSSALSENIADLYISKTDHGKVTDATKRGYITRLYDLLLPF